MKLSPALSLYFQSYLTLTLTSNRGQRSYLTATHAVQNKQFINDHRLDNTEEEWRAARFSLWELGTFVDPPGLEHRQGALIYKLKYLMGKQTQL